eukprot:gnl/Dysnectes_brevis/4845_a6713_560.p1 GENE.gnl/Dysnectes_brevis/4845_a6713_560~~gnl/Dysnectes_brevis/4845_a6713_560.p1  ORF type:complete len:382 (+),score=87.72 gnl/Dysnectes_brevis/4845_a6713_560:938-2083(+)
MPISPRSGVNPTPDETISKLKRELANSIKISDLLQLDHPFVTKISQDYIINTLSIENVLARFSIAEDFQLVSAMTRVVEYLSHHFVEVAHSSSFYQDCPERLLKKLLKGPAVAATSEADLFETIHNWWSFKPDERKDGAMRLLSYICYQVMPPPYLVRVTRHPLVAESPSLQMLTDAAKHFQSLTPEEQQPLRPHFRRRRLLIRCEALGRRGLFGQLGTQLMTRPDYSSPVELGHVELTVSPGSGDPASVLSLENGPGYMAGMGPGKVDGPQECPFYSICLQGSLRLSPSQMAIRVPSGRPTPRSWDVEASECLEGESDWEALAIYRDQEIEAGEVAMLPFLRTPTFFSRFRIVMRGPNSEGGSGLFLDGLELYGLLQRIE